MMSCPEIFDSIVTNVFPDFYRKWPVKERLRLFQHARLSTVDYRLFARLVRPDGQLRAEDFSITSRASGVTVRHPLLRSLVKQYFKLGVLLGKFSPSRTVGSGEMWGILRRRWEQLRAIVREIASAPHSHNVDSQACRERPCLISLCQAIDQAYSHMVHPNFPRPPSRPHWKYLLRKYIRHLLHDLHAGGVDLVEYGKLQNSVFCKRLFSMPWPPTILCLVLPPSEQGGSEQGGFRFRGFTYGPRPEDWDIIWEWDSPVEEFVRDFWEWAENPPLEIPGAWVDTLHTPFHCDSCCLLILED